MPNPFVFEELRRKKKTKADIVKSAPEARPALTGDSCTRRDSVDADMVRKRGRNRHNWATSAKTLPGARVLSCPRRCETLAWYKCEETRRLRRIPSRMFQAEIGGGQCWTPNTPRLSFSLFAWLCSGRARGDENVKMSNLARNL